MSTEPRERFDRTSRREPVNSDDVIEWCDHCLAETPHTVAIRILSESDEPDKEAYSRQPYRQTQCRDCGEADMIRLNDE